MKSNFRIAVIAAAVILALLAFTNPSVEQFRGHLKERGGIAATLGLLAADVLTNGESKGKGIHRDNYLVYSRFYLGGDGILPRQDIAWGAVGRFWEIEPVKK